VQLRVRINMVTSTKKTAIAVVGQEAKISVLSSDDLDGPAEGEFSAFELSDDSVTDTAGLTPTTTWTEPLTLKKVPGGVGKNKKWTTAWVAGVESTKSDIPEKTYLISVVVNKSSPSKSIPATNIVRIPGIAVTEKPELQEIMMHEFSTGTGASLTFNPAPLRAFIRSLTPEQRALLCSYDKKQLVVFISLRGNKPDRPIYADDCGVSEGDTKRKSVLANADFSMFYCEKTGNRVILECHTEYFCVNTGNSINNRPDTRKFLTAVYNSLSPTAKKPRKLWLSAEPHHFIIYMRLLNGHYAFKEGGTTINVGDSVMGNNYIHGLVNTKGCWMLFRNCNWPIRVRDEFLSIYCRDYRSSTVSDAVVISKLTSLGYDVTAATTTRSDSFQKWRDWDQNFAYSFFFDRLIGVKFYSKAKAGYEPTLHNTHGRTVNPTSFTLDEKAFELAHRFPLNADGYDFHQAEEANSNTQWINNRNYVWQPNVRGYKTSRGWGYAFADCYIFNSDMLSLSKLLERPYVEPPPYYSPPPTP
jgi:hypothetical protein